MKCILQNITSPDYNMRVFLARSSENMSLVSDRMYGARTFQRTDSHGWFKNNLHLGGCQGYCILVLGGLRILRVTH